MPSKNIIFYMALFFLTECAANYFSIYSNSLFLSSYPPEYVAYLKIITTSLRPLVYWIFVKVLALGYKRFYFYFMSFLLIFTLPTSYLIYSFYWSPFAYAIYFDMIRLLIFPIYYASATSSLSLMEYKKYANKLLTAGNFGDVFACYSVPFLVKYFTVSSLLYMGTASLLFCTILYYFPSPLLLAEEPHKADTKVIKRPLVKIVLILCLFIAIAHSMSMLLLNYQISKNFKIDEIASFLGWFSGIASLSILIVQSLFAGKIYNHYGVSGLFSLTPIVTLVATVVLTLYHPFFMFAIYAGIVRVFDGSFSVLAINLSILPLPHKMQNMTRGLEGIFDTLGAGISSLLFLMIYSDYVPVNLSLVLLSLLTFSYSIPWLYCIGKQKKYYLQELKEAVNACNFSSLSDLTLNLPTSRQEQFVADMLSKDSSKYTYTALLLLEGDKSLSPKFILQALTLLKNQDELIQVQAIKVLRDNVKLVSSEILKAQLQIENKDLVIWNLVLLLDLYNDQSLKVIGEQALEEPYNSKNIYLLYFALTRGNFMTVGKALLVLTRAMKDENPNIRLATSRLLGQKVLGNSSEELAILVEDREPSVAKAAIEAVHMRNLTSLIPELTRLLNRSEISYTVRQTLEKFGSASVPFLYDFVEQKKEATQSPALKTIAYIEGEEAENAILNLGRFGLRPTKTAIAYYALQASKTIERSSRFKRMCYEILLEEIKYQELLKRILQMTLPKFIENEIYSILHQTLLRCLYWFGCYGEAQVTSQLIMPLMIGSEAESAQVRKNYALEFLSNLTADRQIKQLFSDWENLSLSKPGSKEDMLHLREKDVLFDNLQANYYHQQEQMNSQENEVIRKLIVIREIEAFSNIDSIILINIAREAEWRHILENEVIFVQNEPPEGMYAIVSGEVVISSQGKTLMTLGAKSLFGEVVVPAHLLDAYAKSDVLLLFIPQDKFNHLTLENPEILRIVVSNLIDYLQNMIHWQKQSYINGSENFKQQKIKKPIMYSTKQEDFLSRFFVLREVALFDKLSDEALMALAEKTNLIEMIPGDIIFQQGDLPDGLYIVISGAVNVTSGEDTLAQLKEYDFFGEVALLNYGKRLATVTSVQEGTLLFLGISFFNDLMYDFPQIYLQLAAGVVAYLEQLIKIKINSQ